jgi:hypothetical protein
MHIRSAKEREGHFLTILNRNKHDLGKVLTDRELPRHMK